MARQPLFGLSLVPAAGEMQSLLSATQAAESRGLDLVTVQDHPYNPTFFETWTLITYLAAKTERVRFLTDVANLPLRPPAMLAKSAATLDILSGGRFELGLGTGAFWEGIESYGGPKRTPGQAVDALEEAIEVIQAIWTPDPEGGRVSFEGEHYQLQDAQPGPAPAHRIGIWIGAYKPRMLRLTGRLADGWIPSSSYLPPEETPAAQAVISAAAQEAGRLPEDVRRGYNLAGTILTEGSASMRSNRPGILIGSEAYWVETLLRLIQEYGFDTFSFYPVRSNLLEQTRLFAERVVPAVREKLG